MVQNQSTVDARRCPLCGGANACAMEVQRATGTPRPPCWCLDAQFTRELMERVPGAARGKACICAACAAKTG